MASDDGNSLLEIPGAWVSTELDTNLSSPASPTPHPGIQPAYISTPLKEPPALPLSCDPPSMSVFARPTPHTSHPTLGPRVSDPKVRRGSFVAPVDLKTAAEATPQVRPAWSAVGSLD